MEKLGKWIRFVMLFVSLGIVACDNQPLPSNDGGQPGNPETPGTGSGEDGKPSEFAEGVLFLGESKEDHSYSTLAYMAPDGSIEEDIWQKANGTRLAQNARDLYIYNGKLYIICGKSDSEQVDGGLVVADAKTFKKEKTYPLFDMRFEKPEGTGPEYIPRLLNPTNIVVLDKKNVFIRDQGLFRLDLTTEKMVAVEGTYHIANTVAGHGNLESKVVPRMIVSSGKLYIGSAGFWGDETGVYEIVRDRNEVNRNLKIPVDLIAGVIEGEENQLLLASYTRMKKRYNKVSRIDLSTFTVSETVKPTTFSLAPGFFSRNGVVYSDSYMYLSEIVEKEMETEQKLTLNRINLNTNTAEVVANFKDEVPEAEYLTTNLVMDKHSQSIYVSLVGGTDEKSNSRIHILIYDCKNGDVKLKQKISDKLGFVSGIYFLSDKR